MQQLAGITAFTGADPLPVYRRAVDDLTAALQRRPGNPSLLVDRGSYALTYGDELSDAGRPDEARPVYERAAADDRDALKSDPSDWQAHANLGIVLGRLERWDEAVAPLEAAEQLMPGNPQLQDILADARRRAGR